MLQNRCWSIRSILCVGLHKESLKLISQVGWIGLQIIFHCMASTDGLYSYFLMNISYSITFIRMNMVFLCCLFFCKLSLVNWQLCLCFSPMRSVMAHCFKSPSIAKDEPPLPISTPCWRLLSLQSAHSCSIL